MQANNQENPEIKRPGFFESIKAAVVQPEKYNTFRQLKLGSSLGFFALLILIVVLATAVIISGYINFFVNRAADYYGQNLPEIRIKDGEASVDGEMPIIKKIGGKRESVVFAIDTTGSIKTPEDIPESADNALLLTDKELIFRNNRTGENESYKLSKFGNVTINADYIRSLTKYIPSVVFPILFIFGLFYKIISSIIQALIMGAVSKVYAQSKQKPDLPFVQHFNIAIYAAVGPIIFSLLSYLMLAPIFVPGAILTLIYYGLYIYFVIKATDAIPQQIESDGGSKSESTISPFDQSNNSDLPGSPHDGSGT